LPAFAPGQLFHRTDTRAQRRLLDGLMNSVLPQLLLVVGATVWGLGWLPLHHFASVGLVGMPLVLLVYGSLSVIALPVLWRQRQAWLPQRGGLLVIAICGGGATAALVTAL